MGQITNIKFNTKTDANAQENESISLQRTGNAFDKMTRHATNSIKVSNSFKGKVVRSSGGWEYKAKQIYHKGLAATQKASRLAEKALEAKKRGDLQAAQDLLKQADAAMNDAFNAEQELEQVIKDIGTRPTPDTLGMQTGLFTAIQNASSAVLTAHRILEMT